MRKEKFIDYLQPERMSKVLKHTYVERSEKGDFVVSKDTPPNPYKGVPASAFSIEAVVESGGQVFNPAPIQGNRLQSRDNFDTSFVNLQNEQNQAKIAREEAKTQKALFELFKKD